MLDIYGADSAKTNTPIRKVSWPPIFKIPSGLNSWCTNILGIFSAATLFLVRPLAMAGGFQLIISLLAASVFAPEPSHAQPAFSGAESCIERSPEIERAVWKDPYYPSKQIWGYVDRHSVVPGEFFNLMLSTKPASPPIMARAEIFHMRPSSGGERQIVWQSQAFQISCQAVPSTAAAIGPGWQPTLANIQSAGLQPGYYMIDLVHEDSKVREPNVASFVVKSPRRSGDILIKLGTNTYQAYNSWGGHSLYVSDLYHIQGQIVSFDRPTPPSFLEFDWYYVRWLEAVAVRNGWTIDYATNFDIHTDPNLMDGYRIVIVPGHDEYWTKEEFDAFERRIFVQGKNVLFLGGDIAYAQVRYADVNRAPGSPDQGREMIAYKRLEDPIRWRVGSGEADLLVTARFRDGRRRPETMLTGVGSEGMFTPMTDDNPAYPLYVVRTDLPFFAGTGLQPGASVGNLVGYEWGNSDPTRDGTRLWNSERSRIAALPPERVLVVFEGRPRNDKGEEGRTESVYFTLPSGAKVFSAGTIRWAWGLNKPGFENAAFRLLNEHLIKYFLEPSPR